MHAKRKTNPFTTADVTIKGVAPLIQHSVRLLDPTNAQTRAIKEYTSKRKKTDEDQAEIKFLEWCGGLYCDQEPKVRVFIPSEWIESVIRDGAKVNKRGKDVSAALYCENPRYYLDGPPSKSLLRDLYECDGGIYCDYRAVVVAGKKVMRSRPIFPDWKLSFAVVYNASVLDTDSVSDAISAAGLLKGMGDYRPKYGRFVIESFEVRDE